MVDLVELLTGKLDFAEILVWVFDSNLSFFGWSWGRSFLRFFSFLWQKKLKIIEYLIKEGRLSEAHAMIRAFDTTDKNPVVKARLCYDEGAIYARLFHYGAAAYCMNKAYELSGDSQVKEAYLAALRLSMGEEE